VRLIKNAAPFDVTAIPFGGEGPALIAMLGGEVDFMPTDISAAAEQVTGVFLFASFLYLWRKNIVISVALTIFSLACIYGIFRVVFQVVLPKGTLLPGMC
jgi:hypothetical protein